MLAEQRGRRGGLCQAEGTRCELAMGQEDHGTWRNGKEASVADDWRVN